MAFNVPSVPELVKRTRSREGNALAQELREADLVPVGCVVDEAVGRLILHGFNYRRIGVAQDECGHITYEVESVGAVYVQGVAPLAMLYIYRVGLPENAVPGVSSRHIRLGFLP